MLATIGNLDEVAALARAAKARGATTIDFEIEALVGFAKFVTLWEGIVGEVVDRIFATPETPCTPGIPRPRVVKYFRVRCCCADIIEAQRRRAEHEAQQFGGIPSP